MRPVKRIFTGWVPSDMSSSDVLCYEPYSYARTACPEVWKTKTFAGGSSTTGKARKVRVTIIVEDVL